MISTSKVELHHKIGRKINCHSHIHLYILAALHKKFLQFLFAYLGFSEGLDHFWKKLAKCMHSVEGGRPMF
jgi:hypothetical protein